MPLHIDYRPPSLKELFGNKALKESLSKILEREKDHPHAWLLEGPAGSGKTSIARIISKTLGCDPVSNPDYSEINCGNHGNIETVRNIERDSGVRPFSSKCRVWVLDEAHALGVGGNSTKNMPQRALLKILEDCPKHVHIILCTTNPEMLIKTIKSRCTTFKVQKLDDKTMHDLIDYVLEKEDVHDFPKDAIEKLIEAADGHPRDALKILDQVIDLEDESIIPSIKGFKTAEAQIYDLFWGLINRNSWKAISDMLNTLKTQGEDPEGIRRAIIGLASTMLLKGASKDKLDLYMDILDLFSENISFNGFPGIVLKCYQYLNT